jgi:hypothetical protein
VIVHASAPLRCTDGSYRYFGTLCGLDAGGAVGEVPSLSVKREEVTCKTCLRSSAWPAMLLSVKRMHNDQDS